MPAGAARLKPCPDAILASISTMPRSRSRSIRDPQIRTHTSWRIGIGNDLHRLATGRKLVLGGVRIPFDKGPVGHSDGDALAHAICDALLGAAALGDIGRHFPNSSPRWRNASSLIFLRRVRKMLDAAGYTIANIDATIGIEQPKLAPHIPRMQKRVAAALGLRPEQVSVKAKTADAVALVARVRI